MILSVRIKSIIMWLATMAIILIPTALGIYYRINILNNFTSIDITIYGVVTLSRFFIQMICAGLNNQNHKKISTEDCESPGVAILICGWKEKLEYFQMCLNSINKLEYFNKRVICLIDGNEESDMYMYEKFKEIFPEHDIIRSDMIWNESVNLERKTIKRTVTRSRTVPRIVPRDAPATPAVPGTNHYTPAVPETVPEEDLRTVQSYLMEEGISLDKPLCIMQQHKGKRHVLYTGYQVSNYFNIPYVLTVDSDTILEPDSLSCMISSTMHMKDKGEKIGAITGNIKIFNIENFISFISSIRYWFAFNIERSAQSYWGCVSCIAGPLGLYDTEAIMEVVEDWYDQKFLGKECTYGDDRHMTNRLLSKGYKIYYTPQAVAWTETPVSIKRFILQQLRWSKSFIREYYYNIFWFSESSLYLMIDLTFMMLYSYFLIYVILNTLYQSPLVYTYAIVIIIFIISLIKAIVAIIMSGDFDNIFFTIYSFVFIMFMIPIKIWATLTLFNTGWGTGNRLVNTLSYCDINIMVILAWNVVLLSAIGINMYGYYEQYKDNKQTVVDILLYVIAGLIMFSALAYKRIYIRHKSLRKFVYDKYM